MKSIIHTPDAPSPIGPYSQAIKAGGMLYLSGQIAINPATDELVNTGLEAETHQVMMNLKAVLLAAGLDFTHVVKTGIFLKDMGFFSVVNEVYAKYFDGEYPARETVAVAGLPRNVNVEISMIASFE